MGLSAPLLYVQHFALTGTPADQPDIGMFSLHHRFVNNLDGSLSWLGSIILMLDIVHTVELIPRYGRSARRDVMSETCLELYDDFLSQQLFRQGMVLHHESQISVVILPTFLHL